MGYIKSITSDPQFLFGLVCCLLLSGCHSTAAVMPPPTQAAADSQTLPLDEAVEADNWSAKPPTRLATLIAKPSPATAAPAAERAEEDKPLTDEDNFFTAPTFAAAALQPSAADQVYEPVRLVGFVHPSSNSAETRAILKIGQRLVLMRPGEEREGVELLEIDERSVNLQRGRERWQLALMEQPIVNKAVPSPAPSLSRQRPSPWKPSPTDPEPEPTSVIEPEAVIEPLHDMPEMEVPPIQLPDIPEMPALPDLDELGRLHADWPQICRHCSAPPVCPTVSRNDSKPGSWFNCRHREPATC